MIQINRKECPSILSDAPVEPTLYNRRVVVHALWEMQEGKCCYCEQPIPDRGHSKAVEHFKPKDKFHFLRNEWGNLLLACSQCNGKKSNLFPVELTEKSEEPKAIFLTKKNGVNTLLIDPSDLTINPEDHITFETIKVWGVIIEKNGSKKGMHTIDTIGLSSTYFTKKRLQHHKYLAQLESNLRTAISEGEPDQVRQLKKEVNRCVSDKGKFASYARTYFRKRGIISILE